MRVVPVYEAEGMVLGHDLTEIVPGKVKSRAFKKGHIVRREDIPKLLDIGKEHLYVWQINDKVVHENDAALRIAQAVAGPGICMGEPRQRDLLWTYYRSIWSGAETQIFRVGQYSHQTDFCSR